MHYDKCLLISMILKSKIKNKKTIFLIILIIFLMHSNNVFYNLYILSKYKLSSRLSESYGYCGNASYGFINYIFENYEISENPLILNDNPNFSFNNSVWFKYKINKDTNIRKIILINNIDSLKYVNKDIVSLSFKKKDFGLYKIIENKKNCFYLEKND